MILITMIVVVIYGAKNWELKGDRLSEVSKLNKTSWSDAIGFSVYAYEGIGIILPVGDVTKNPETYPKIVVVVIITICIIFVSFGQFCVMAWGEELTTPLITDQLPSEWPSWMVKALFAINLIFSFPLVLYPAIMIGDNYLFSGWPKSPKRQWFKNLNRMVQVGIVVLITIGLG